MLVPTIKKQRREVQYEQNKNSNINEKDESTALIKIMKPVSLWYLLIMPFRNVGYCDRRQSHTRNRKRERTT